MIGLGYVGLPLAVAFAKQARVIGFDISAKKIEELSRGVDVTGEVLGALLPSAPLRAAS